ncbi:MAG: aminotransferase class V-fold PLP-dependent enzyme [Flavobacteriales bacterium]|nr:aminotransferase class V-fold PLP-dependent enzyme [Flavobacteriales bacterium]
MLENQKHLFSLKEDIYYLNCAYKAPLLKSAEAAAIADLVKQRNPANLLPTDYFKEAEEVRELFGRLVNSKPSEVAIIPSTSYGFSSVLNNISCKEGQHAITVESEFPSDYFSIERWCKTHQAELKVISPDANSNSIAKTWNQNILDSISEQTAVVIISSVHWMSGLKFDLARIGEKCKTVGAKFIVDGTQSVGAIPIDVKACKIDALICASYKWLFGPYSVALAFIGEAFHQGIPLEETWMNRTNAQNFAQLTEYESEYTPDAGRYNVGQVSNLTLMPMLIASLQQIHEWSVEGIQLYCRELVLPLLQYLKAIKVDLEEETYFSHHLFSLPLPSQIDTTHFTNELKRRNIILSVRDGKLRVSVNIFNTPKDIQQLIRAIEQNRN